MVADGDGHVVGFEVRADDIAHLGHQAGVAGVVERLRLLVGHLRRFRVGDDVARGHPGVVLVAGVEAVRVVGAVHRHERVAALDGAAEVHPDAVVEAHLLADEADDFGRADERRVGELARVGDVVGVPVRQEDVVGRVEVRGFERRVGVVEERVDEQRRVADGDVPTGVAVPSEFHGTSVFRATAT